MRPLSEIAARVPRGNGARGAGALRIAQSVTSATGVPAVNESALVAADGERRASVAP